MTLLARLTDNQKEIIISLPYRVGVWVSRSDSGGGSESEQQELDALSSIIHAFAEDIFGSETMQHIISATLAKKESWPRWAQNTQSLTDDCALAIDILRDHCDTKDIAAFRMQLMEIAEAVALAFQENENETIMARVKNWIEWFISQSHQSATARRKSFEEFLRISSSERKALTTLADALGASY